MAFPQAFLSFRLTKQGKTSAHVVLHPLIPHFCKHCQQLVIGLAPFKITQAKLVEKNRFSKIIFQAKIDEDDEVLFNITRPQVAHVGADGCVLCQWILNDLGGDQKHVTDNSLLYVKIYHFERDNCDSGCWILRLQQTNKSDIEPYTALSYRQGGDQKLKTTKDTFDGTQIHISYKKLPETIQDTIMTTHKVGIRFLSRLYLYYTR